MQRSSNSLQEGAQHATGNCSCRILRHCALPVLRWGSACGSSLAAPCSRCAAPCSITDTTVPQRLRGKYLAFSPQHIAEAAGQHFSPASPPPTAGLQHLAKLRAAGLNHLHLLPTYDFGSVPEREHEQLTVQVRQGQPLKQKSGGVNFIEKAWLHAMSDG